MPTTQLSERNAQSHWSVANRVLRSALAVICCSGVAELVAIGFGQKCVFTCIVSLALGWASKLAAFG